MRIDARAKAPPAKRSEKDYGDENGTLSEQREASEGGGEVLCGTVSFYDRIVKGRETRLEGFCKIPWDESRDYGLHVLHYYFLLDKPNSKLIKEKEQQRDLFTRSLLAAFYV